MRLRTRLISGLAVVATLAATAIGTSMPAEAIHTQETAWPSIGAYPYAVSLQIDNGGEPAHCTGVLYRELWVVLTAAHCVYRNNSGPPLVTPDKILITAGSDRPNDLTTVSDGNRIHPVGVWADTSGSEPNHDWAVLFLAHPALAPAEVISGLADPVSSTFPKTVVGFRYCGNSRCPLKPVSVQLGAVPLSGTKKATKECAKWKHTYCLGQDALIGTDGGDSGGPLVETMTQSRPATLIGLTEGSVDGLYEVYVALDLTTWPQTLRTRLLSMPVRANSRGKIRISVQSKSATDGVRLFAKVDKTGVSVCGADLIDRCDPGEYSDVTVDNRHYGTSRDDLSLSFIEDKVVDYSTWTNFDPAHVMFKPVLDGYCVYYDDASGDGDFNDMIVHVTVGVPGVTGPFVCPPAPITGGGTCPTQTPSGEADSLSVIKVDEVGCPVLGAEILVRFDSAADGTFRTVVDDFVTNGTPHTIRGLAPGLYEVTEIGVPGAYCPTSSQTPTVSTTQQTVVTLVDVTLPTDGGSCL